MRVFTIGNNGHGLVGPVAQRVESIALDSVDAHAVGGSQACRSLRAASMAK